MIPPIHSLFHEIIRKSIIKNVEKGCMNRAATEFQKLLHLEKTFIAIMLIKPANAIQSNLAVQRIILVVC